ncbi:MAG TPA: phosphatase PAP2 family protein [Candidatus Dormibacteraeota bacterium]
MTRVLRIRPVFAWLGAAGMAVFAVDTYGAARQPYVGFDVPVERFVQGLPIQFLLPVFRLLDQVEGTRQLALGIAAIVLVFLLNTRAGPLIFIGSLSGPIYSVTQSLIQRPRPDEHLVHVIRQTGSYSYPSGHVAFFSWMCVLLVVCLLWGRMPKALLAVAWTVASLLLLTVCVGRLYLGEHWPSDVIGGLALGLGWTSLALSIGLLSDPVLGRRDGGAGRNAITAARGDASRVPRAMTR